MMETSSRNGSAPEAAEAPAGARLPDAVLLLGKGGYGQSPRDELDRMVAAVQATGRYPIVRGTFIEQGVPSLPQALQGCVDAGAQRILIIPVFVPVDRTLRIWMPKIVRRWLRQHKGLDVEVIMADALGDHPSLGAAVVQAVADAEHRADIRIGAPVDRGNPDWSVIPRHRYHVLTCGGPRCTTRCSGDLWRHLANRLEERGLDRGPDQVFPVRTGCLYPCNLGPVMVVYPDGVWYCALTESAIDRIVEEHFIGGRVVEQYARAPGPKPYKRPDE